MAGNATGPGAWGRRHTVLMLCGLAMFVAYTDRVNMSVAVVAMRAQFGWSQTVKGVALAAFFVGYLACMLPSAWLAKRYGGRRVLAGAVLWWSAFTALTPLAAAFSLPALILARIGLGMGEAAVMPAGFALLASWAPARERTRATAAFLSGIPLGQVAGFAGSGALTQAFGWPMSFYVFGTLGVAWSIVWLILAGDDPLRDARVTPAERALYPQRPAAPASSAAEDLRALRALARHAPVWAVIATHFGITWSLYVLLSWLPSYFREVQGLSIADAGLYTAAPWLVNFLMLNLTAVGTDFALARGAPLLNVRRVLIALGFFGLAAFLLLLREAHSAPGALALICAAAGCIGIANNGFAPNAIEVAPRHAALLMGISNTIATLPGIVGVGITGWLVEVTHTYAAAFLLAASVAAASALVFLRFGRTQPIDL